jgi:hypothetical protein
LGKPQGFFVSKKELYKFFFYFSVFLFLREFDEGIKGADDGQPKIRQHELFGGLMMSYR